MSPKTAYALLLGWRAAVLLLLAGSFLVFVPGVTAQTSVINVSVLPTTVSVHVPGGMQQFDARVTTARGNGIVRWSLSGPGCSGASCGTLSETTSASGSAITYTAPAKLPIPAKIFLTARSASDRSRKARATIILAGRTPAAVDHTMTASLHCATQIHGCGPVALRSVTAPAAQ
jgi:hypothetical protein